MEREVLVAERTHLIIEMQVGMGYERMQVGMGHERMQVGMGYERHVHLYRYI